jgi:hypothetical protein
MNVNKLDVKLVVEMFYFLELIFCEGLSAGFLKGFFTILKFFAVVS